MNFLWRMGVHVLHGWAWCMLELTELILGLGDLPDGRPALPDHVDHEYFDLLEQEAHR